MNKYSQSCLFRSPKDKQKEVFYNTHIFLEGDQIYSMYMATIDRWPRGGH